MAKKYTQKQKELILKLYQEAQDLDEAILRLKEQGIVMTRQAMADMAHDNGIKRKRIYTKQNKLSVIEIRQLVSDYESGIFTMEELIKKYGFKTRKSITDKVKLYNGKMRTQDEANKMRKTYEETMFNKLDAEWKAYMVGLLLTDGYITNDQIGLDLTDEDAISYLAEMTGKGNYTTIVDSCKSKKAKYRLTLNSKTIIDDLTRFGVVPRKSLTLKGPLLNEDERNYIPHIFKGIIDGDGWIRSDGKEFFIVSASRDFLEWCIKELILLGMSNLKITQKTFDNEKWNDCFLVRTALKSNITILKEKIYVYDLGMGRKREKLFQEGRSETTTRKSQ